MKLEQNIDLSCISSSGFGIRVRERAPGCIIWVERERKLEKAREIEICKLGTILEGMMQEENRSCSTSCLPSTTETDFEGVRERHSCRGTERLNGEDLINIYNTRNRPRPACFIMHLDPPRPVPFDIYNFWIAPDPSPLMFIIFRYAPIRIVLPQSPCPGPIRPP